MTDTLIASDLSEFNGHVRRIVRYARLNTARIRGTS